MDPFLGGFARELVKVAKPPVPAPVKGLLRRWLEVPPHRPRFSLTGDIIMPLGLAGALAAMRPTVVSAAEDAMDKIGARAPRSVLTPGSSNVRGFRYDPATKALFITYQGGGSYRYDNVPPAAARALGRAKSVGKAVNKRIKGGGYAYEKIGWEDRLPGGLSDGKTPKDFDAKALRQGQRAESEHTSSKHLATEIAMDHLVEDPKYYPKLEKLEKAANLPFREWSHELVQDIIAKLVGWRQDGFTASHRRHRKHAGVAPPDGYKVSRRVDEKAGDRSHDVIELHRDGDLAGWLASHPGSDGDYVWLKSMYVAPEHRGKGLAHVLMENAIADAPGREIRLRARPFRDESTSVEALQALYGRHGFEKLDDENRMVRHPDAVIKHAAEKVPPSTKWLQRVDAVAKKRGYDFFAIVGDAAHPNGGTSITRVANGANSPIPAARKALVKWERANGHDPNHDWRLPKEASSIVASMRGMAKVAGVAKKQITWQGLPMKIEHEPGDVRKGTHKDGTSWERTMYDSYGYIPGTKGKAADGDAIDVYFSHAPVDGPVFEIRQLKKDTKAYDESKFMVGFGSAEEAKRAYLRHMPAWAFGELSPVGKTFDDFKTYLER